jgi:hypothetical protein
MQNPINEAAYVEIRVIMLKIAHRTKRKLKTAFSEEALQRAIILLQTGQTSLGGKDPRAATQPLFSEESSILLVRAVAIHALYSTATMFQMDQLYKLIESAISYDIDIACDILDHISIIWNVKDNQAGDLAKALEIYISAYSATESNRIRTVALRNIADTLEQLFQSGSPWRAYVSCQNFRHFGLSLCMKGTPDLSNAEIRITGSLLALDFLYHNQQNSVNEVAGRIQEWGIMLSDHGSCGNVSICSAVSQMSFAK